MLMPHTASPEPTSTDPRWTAVAAHDSRADGAFVYAVRSTGIYCRPSCPSRRPRPDRVEYFPTPAAASAAGYRACRRCDPKGVSPAPVTRKIAAALALLEHAEPGHVPTLAALSKRVGCSAPYLQRAFVRVLGVSPREYASALRLARFKSGLRQRRTIADATFEAGFGSSSRVYEQSARALGMTPAQYRRGGAGLELMYVTTPCPLGVVLVAGTPRGVSAVTLGDSAAGNSARRPSSARTRTRSATALARCCATSAASRPRPSTFRWTSARPRSSAASGALCSGSRPVRGPHTRKSPP
jgi:AraC family transcriptional regulator, regulatory protein of adaptative response / methylated-DNA-[protein]-cysteine methyltransferase